MKTFSRLANARHNPPPCTNRLIFTLRQILFKIHFNKLSDIWQQGICLLMLYVWANMQTVIHTENHGHRKSNDDGNRCSKRTIPYVRDGIETGQTEILRPSLKYANFVDYVTWNWLLQSISWSFKPLCPYPYIHYIRLKRRWQISTIHIRTLKLANIKNVNTSLWITFWWEIICH